MLRMLFPGTTVRDVFKRSSSALMVAAMVLSAITPLVLSGNANAAGQVTSRKITISSSKAGLAGVTYSVSFNPKTITGDGTDDIKGIVVDFCQSGAGSGGGPLPGTVCGKTNGVAGIPVSGNVSVTHTGATGSPVSFTVNDPAGATAMDGSTLILTSATGLDVVNASNPITFSFTATNPTGDFATNNIPATFYARIITYNVVATAQAYDSITANAANPGTHIDEGGIALSTANQLTVNARVQEELEFCVGAVDETVISNATAPANCAAGAFGSTPTVDIGVVSSGTIAISPSDKTSVGNSKNGAVMIRTNGANGASITYFSEQETSSGRLKVGGATCSGTTGTFDTGSSVTDQCFNSNADQDDAGNVFTTAGEKFGMTSSNVFRPTGSTTTNLTRDVEYNGVFDEDNTETGVDPVALGTLTKFAWNQAGTTTTLATSTSVLDYEMLLLRFAARAAATTPTGQYTVLSTYVATSTF